MFLGFPGKPVATPPSTLSPAHHCVVPLSLHFLFLPPPPDPESRVPPAQAVPALLWGESWSCGQPGQVLRPGREVSGAGNGELSETLCR